MNAIVDNTVNVATVVNAAGLTASVVEVAEQSAVVSYNLPLAAVVQPSQSINLITVSGPQGPIGLPGTGGVANLTGQFPIYYDAGSGIVGIVSGYYVTFPDLTSASGALVAQISAASAGVNAINGLSGFVTFAAVKPLFVSVAGQTISISGSGLATSGDVNALASSIVALSGYTNLLVAATGQAAWTAAQNNAVNLSGALQSTGSSLYALITGNTGIANISGYITTGQADVRYYPLATNPSGYVTTGQTGQFYPMSNPQGYASSGFVTGISGALQAMMGSTGGVLSINGASGVLQVTGAGNVTVSRAGQLITISGVNSGEVSQAQLDSLSGYVNAQDQATGRASILYTSGASGVLQTQINLLPTAIQLAQTGSDLYRLITGESGQGVIDYATKIQLTQSGINLMEYANGVGTNLSGNLTQTGIQLIARDNSISGVLQGQIDGIAAGTGNIPTNVVYTSGTQFISGTKYFIGSTYIDNLFVTGQQTIINTQDLYVADNWIVMNATGAARDSALFIATGFTGASATGAVIGWDVPSNSWRFGLASQQTDLFTLPSIASGEAVDAANARITVLSGFVTGVSGALEGRITITGQQAWTAANNNGVNLSGQLNVSGSYLYVTLTGMSGQDVTNYATKIQLITTGQILDSKINSLSGQAESIYVHRLGNELISGDKTWSGNAYFMSGKVGIGTTNPIQSLVISSTGTPGGGTFIQTINTVGRDAGILMSVISGGIGQQNWLISNWGKLSTPYNRLAINDGISEVMTMLTGGGVGINTSNPTGALHVNGPICLSGIDTSTTANVGAATLPANPVGFVVINITGANFKIPYYNI